MLNARYTDQDVRASEELYRIAIRHLQAYQGDWHFLVSAKNYLSANGDIPIATARGVLNAMRSDPLGAMMLPQTPTGRFEYPSPYTPINASDNGHLRRPAHIDLKSTWHVQYVLSTWPTAQVFHVLRPELSWVRWYPHQEKFGCDITVWCGYPMGWSWHSPYIMTNDKRGRRICKGCERRMEAYQNAQR